MLFQARGEDFHAFFGAHLVEYHAQHLGILGAAKQLGLQFDPARQVGEHFVFRSRDQNDFGIQALGQMQIDPCGIARAAGRDHAFDDQHVLADSCLLIKIDDLFEQFIQLTITEHALHMRQSQRLGRLEAMGASHQFGRALGAQIAGMWLGDRFEKAYFQTSALQRAHQSQADGGQPHAKVSGGDKKSLHTGFSIEQCKGRSRYGTAAGQKSQEIV